MASHSEDIELQNSTSFGGNRKGNNDVISALHHDTHTQGDQGSNRSSLTSTVEKKDLYFWYVFVVFMVMGSGSNWVFATALAQEIPYFQENLPGGLCLGAYMNAATQINLFFVIAYVIIHRCYPIPHTISVPFILVLGAFGSYLTAGTYQLLTDGFPLALYIACVIGGIVGGLSAVIMQPFLTYFKNDFISAARSGGSAGMILTALLAIAQDPGASNQHYSVAMYFVAFGILLSLSVVAYFYVIHSGIGLRDPSISPLNSTSFIEAHESQKSLNKHEPPRPSDVQIDAIYDHSGQNSQSAKRDSLGASHDSQFARSWLRDWTDPISDWLLDSLVPQSWFERIPWLRITLPYLVTIAWIDFNTWGLLSSLVPFAMANASFSGGALNLAIAYEVSAFTLFFGDFSTVYFRLPYIPGIIVFTTFAFVIYAFAGSPNSNPSSATAPILIIIWSIGRFIEAHLLTQSYRAVASELPLKYREEASRWIGLTDQVFSFVGTVVSTAIVVSTANCN